MDSELCYNIGHNGLTFACCTARVLTDPCGWLKRALHLLLHSAVRTYQCASCRFNQARNSSAPRRAARQQTMKYLRCAKIHVKGLSIWNLCGALPAQGITPPPCAINNPNDFSLSCYREHIRLIRYRTCSICLPLDFGNGHSLWVISPLAAAASSDRQHLSYDVCLEVRGEIIRTVLCCIV